MTLREARCKFSLALAYLVLKADLLGFDVAFDEVTERLTEKDPTSDHKAGSNHHIGLAADLLLYKDGVYLQDSLAYKELGLAWEALGKERGLELVWGGRFKSPDGNHFSLKWQGHA